MKVLFLALLTLTACSKQVELVKKKEVPAVAISASPSPTPVKKSEPLKNK